MILENPHRLHTFGTILLWLGVLVWAPYFAQRFAGESPSLMAYLPFHLAGVIGGARMRTSARKKLGIPREKRKGYKRVAHWIVIASLLVWLPYYGLKLAGQPVALNPFLTVHLAGIFGGTGLMVAGGIFDKLHNRSNGGLHGSGHPAQENDG
jgi:hypothetical protein